MYLLTYSHTKNKRTFLTYDAASSSV